MAATVYHTIYSDIKRGIIEGRHAFGEVLPSESDLCERYGCSRNTVRRALALLADEGYTQVRAGSGTRVIWRATDNQAESLGQLTSFREQAERAGRQARNEVYAIDQVWADEKIEELTGFAAGTELVRVREVRFLDECPVQVDEHLFPAEVGANLTRKKAEWSIFAYLEGELGLPIATSKRLITVEKPSVEVRERLGLGPHDACALVRSRTFCTDGTMVEFMESHIHPAYFCYADTTVRRRTG